MDSASAIPVETPVTPTRLRIPTIPPFSPRTPLRKGPSPLSGLHDPEHTPIKDVTLASGASLIVRGVGANKRNSDPQQIMTDAIVKMRTNNPDLVPVIVKTFPRGEWLTTCYILIDTSVFSRCLETEPRTDLLEIWMHELTAYDPTWNVAWHQSIPV